MPLEKLRIPKREGWSEVVDTWSGVLDRYEEKSGDDVAYWHGENSLTASLATAAWLANGAALVEFETKRIRRVQAQSGSGAGDAYLCIGKDWYTVEAKLCWYSDELEPYLGLASSNLQTIHAPDRVGTHALALCYCVLFIPEGKPPAQAIEQAKADLMRRFPRCELLLVYTPLAKQAPSHDGKTYPGMVVVGEFIDWPV